ncbi:GSCOCG00008267001-RA-CDS, partial [Cotesia congregata]
SLLLSSQLRWQSSQLQTRNPCPGACGDMARCSVLNHSPVCSCPEGYTGDPSTQCTPAMPSIPEPRPTNPCLPNPCGPNAQCRERNGAGAC